MKLLEHQAKDIFRKYGIPTPRGQVVHNSQEAGITAEALGGSVVVKAQLPVGGRGKAGGILFANNPKEAKKAAVLLLGKLIKGLTVKKLLVEEKLNINNEVYLGITLDRSYRSYTILASSEGGINIEEVASTSPEKIIKYPVNPLEGLKVFHALWLAKQLGFTGSFMTDLSRVIQRLYRLAYEMDVELTEINPLVLTNSGFIAADARLNIDNNALYRHPEISEFDIGASSELSTREKLASEKGLTYVELDGDIGVVSNGAGLTMATLDIVNLIGGKPANFLDLGGGASTERIELAISFLLEDIRVKVLLVNILGGITRCDDIARGIIQAQKNSSKPIVVRLMGTNEKEGRLLLSNAGIKTLDSMDEAANIAIQLAEGELDA